MNQELSDKQPIAEFPQYLIAETGEITNVASDQVVPTFFNNDGELSVTLKNAKRSPIQFRIAKLVLLHFGEKDTEIHYNLANVLYRDGNKANVHIDNLSWTFDAHGYRPYHIPGINIRIDAFVIIPGYSRYQINSLGIIQRLKDGTIVPHMVGTRGYESVTLIDDTGYRAPVKVHRLLALIFLPHPHDTKGLTVNHKDGVKTHNWLSNLEWVTGKYNIQHAYANDLVPVVRTKGQILAMKIDTREVRKFSGPTECAAFFNVTLTTIDDPLKNRRGIRPYAGYYLKYENDPRPWPAEDATFNVYGTKAVLLKHIMSGEITRFESMQDAGLFLGSSTSSIFNQLVYEKPRPYKGYLIRHDTVDVDWTPFDPKSWFSRKGWKINVMDIYTGEMTTYDSISVASVLMGCSEGTLASALHRGSPTGRLMVSYVTPIADTRPSLS